MNIKMRSAVSIATLALAGVASQAMAADCSNIVASRTVMRGYINTAAANFAAQGGYGLPMWVTLVDVTGTICGVFATTSSATPVPVKGTNAGNSAWLGSRVISAQKANTANAFNLDGYAISSANLFTPVSSGSLYGLQHSNPVDASRAYSTGDSSGMGTGLDGLTNLRIGGVNVFGGGLALYSGGVKVGAIGVSGDTSCRDHAFAWDLRAAMGMAPSTGTTGITKTNLHPDGVTAVPALTVNGAGGTLVGDELIMNPTGFFAPAHANTVAGASTRASYWDFWSHPFCPNSDKPHASYVFIQ